MSRLAIEVGISYLAAWGIGLGYGYALERSTMWTEGAVWERQVLTWFHNQHLSAWLDQVMLDAPYFGTNLTILPLMIVVAIVLWRRGRLLTGVQLLTVSVGSLSMNPTMKYLLHRPRPALFPLRGLWDWPSYPSGHAILTTALYFTVAMLLRRERGSYWMFPVAAFVVLLTCYSRLYLAVHWPTDVLGGLLMGFMWLAGSWKAFARFQRPVQSPAATGSTRAG